MKDAGKGIWVDGRISQEEVNKLTSLLEQVVLRFRSGQLPSDRENAWKYEDEKITFKAWRRGQTLVVYYGWKFPPRNLWVKETKTKAECCNCRPEGLGRGDIGREVWCEKLGYNFSQCPYGVLTPNKHGSW